MSGIPDRPSIVALAQAHTDRLAEEYVRAVEEALQQVNTVVRDDWGSRLQDERHSALDAAAGVTLDDLLGDIDTLLKDDT